MSTTVSVSHSETRPSKGLNVWLWVAQVLLAAGFGMAGDMKTTMPITYLARTMMWPGALPTPLVRFIGASELAAAIGLIVPAATRVRPMLTPLAATGLVVVMALAMAFHLSRGEAQLLPINVALGALAAFIAWGRSLKAPISAR